MNQQLVDLISKVLSAFSGIVGAFTFLGGLVMLGLSYGSQDPNKQDLSYKLIAGGVIAVGLAFALPGIVKELFAILPKL